MFSSPTAIRSVAIVAAPSSTPCAAATAGAITCTYAQATAIMHHCSERTPVCGRLAAITSAPATRATSAYAANNSDASICPQACRCFHVGSNTMHIPPRSIGAKCGLASSSGSTSAVDACTKPTRLAKKSDASPVTR